MSSHMDIWQDQYFRQTGRTSRMLAAAVVTAIWRSVVIVGADARHVDILKGKYLQLVDRFSVEGLSPLGSISMSVAHGWLHGVVSPLPDTMVGEQVWESREELVAHFKLVTSFAHVTELGFKVQALTSIPQNLVAFVDHHAADAIIEQVLLRGLR